MEAKAIGLPTIFLCHSHLDKELVTGLVRQFDDAGWKVYVDWEDASLPAKPDRSTAERIQRKIVELSYFMLLATPNSMTSRWCPWEIGYADGKKPRDKIVIVPTEDTSGQTYGSEYLDLYDHIEPGSNNTSKRSGLALFDSLQKTGRFLGDL